MPRPFLLSDLLYQGTTNRATPHLRKMRQLQQIKGYRFYIDQNESVYPR
jgi:hypothetical protein